MNSVQYIYRASVVRVVDGDTVDLRVDLGFGVRFDVRTRLYGINSPEMNTAAGRAAKAYLSEALPVGTPVTMYSYKSPTDKYGRWLATLTKVGATVTVNDALVADGHAVAAVYSATKALP